MSLPWRSLQKLVRDHIRGGSPLELNPGQVEEIAAELFQRIQNLPKTTWNDHCYRKSSHPSPNLHGEEPSNLVCSCILLQEDSPVRWREGTHLHLLSCPDRHLRIELGFQTSQPLSHLDEVIGLIQAFHHRIEQQKALEIKRHKQRELKYQAVLAQVRKMAKEDQFDFAMECDRIKLRLSIRLPQEDYFEILIPFKGFQEILPKLRTAIQSLRETYHAGIHFKYHTSQSYHRSDWIRHQDL